MIELSNATSQTLTTGQSLTFDTVILKSGCAEAHRANSSVVTLRSNCGIYDIRFTGNITSTTTGHIQLVIELDGEPLNETTMISTVTTDSDANNVSSSTLVKTCACCCGKITVVNNGINPVVVEPNSALIVKRVA